MHKVIQSKVVAELHQIFGKTLYAPFIDQEQLNDLQYMELVINEAMRLMPVVPIVFRKVNDEVTLSDGCILPKGGNVIIPIYKIHHNKDIWGDDAEQFRPDRFEKENLEKIHPYAFIPFTKGPRMCLGYRYGITLMKIQLVNFLLRYEVDTSLKYEELEFELNTTLNICQGYMIRIKKRQN
jgi:cytochrome P450 family 313